MRTEELRPAWMRKLSCDYPTASKLPAVEGANSKTLHSINMYFLASDHAGPFTALNSVLKPSISFSPRLSE